MAKIFLTVLVCLAFAAGCTASSGSPAKADSSTGSNGGEVEVVIQNFSFSPQTITVAPGTTVRWAQKDGVQHTVTSDTGLFDSGLLSQGKTYSYKFTTAGTYTYHCTPHPYMQGTIIVK